MSSTFAEMHQIENLLKKISIQRLEESILKPIQKAIDNLFAFSDYLRILLTSQIQTMGLSQNDCNILNILNQKDSSKATGKQFWQMFVKAANQEPLPHVKKFEELFTNIWNPLNDNIKKETQKISVILQGETYKINGLFSRPKTALAHPMFQLRLLTFFQPKTIVEAQLLHRASQCGFDAKIFHQKWNKIPHTLIICQTEFGKLIGGYTPLMWSSANHSMNSMSEYDNSGNLLSILQLTLTNLTNLAQQAISQPFINAQILGQHLAIKLFTLTTNQTPINHLNLQYVNNNYKSGDSQSLLIFHGDPAKNGTFKTKQWQIWQLKLSQ